MNVMQPKIMAKNGVFAEKYTYQQFLAFPTYPDPDGRRQHGG